LFLSSQILSSPPGPSFASPPWTARPHRLRCRPSPRILPCPWPVPSRSPASPLAPFVSPRWTPPTAASSISAIPWAIAPRRHRRLLPPCPGRLPPSSSRRERVRSLPGQPPLPPASSSLWAPPPPSPLALFCPRRPAASLLLAELTTAAAFVAFESGAAAAGIVGGAASAVTTDACAR